MTGDVPGQTFYAMAASDALERARLGEDQRQSDNRNRPHAPGGIMETKAFLLSAAHCAAIVMAFEQYDVLTEYEKELVRMINSRWSFYEKLTTRWLDNV